MQAIRRRRTYSRQNLGCSIKRSGSWKRMCRRRADCCWRRPDLANQRLVTRATIASQQTLEGGENVLRHVNVHLGAYAYKPRSDPCGCGCGLWIAGFEE